MATDEQRMVTEWQQMSKEWLMMPYKLLEDHKRERKTSEKVSRLYQ